MNRSTSCTWWSRSDSLTPVSTWARSSRMMDSKRVLGSANFPSIEISVPAPARRSRIGRRTGWPRSPIIVTSRSKSCGPTSNVPSAPANSVSQACCSFWRVAMFEASASNAESVTDTVSSARRAAGAGMFSRSRRRRSDSD